MNELVGKTITEVQEVNSLWSDKYILICSDGTKFEVGSGGGHDESSYIEFKELP